MVWMAGNISVFGVLEERTKALQRYLVCEELREVEARSEAVAEIRPMTERRLSNAN
jgi:hypothetical protein